jgi:molecular chaperone DnaJ
MRRRVEREVRIPPGVDNDTRLRLGGEGNQSADRGTPGDCYCFISVKEHALFHREGQHLVCQVPLTYSQAALGAKIDVPTLAGREELTIPAGTQPGDVFRLRGRGMPDARQRSLGDLLVQVSLEVPKTLTPRQEELLRELAEEEQANVSAHRKSFFEKLKDYFMPAEEPTGERQ